MNRNVYRKAALARLSSPEDLDRMLTVTSSRHWIVLVGFLLFAFTVILWSFLARLPSKAYGDGMFMGEGGVVNVVTPGTGEITDFKLKIGDTVHAGDVVATIAQPEIVTSIRQAENRLKEAKADADRTIHVQDQSTLLQIAALDQQRSTVEGDIKREQELAALAADQIPVERKLLDQGLTTKQQLIAAQQKEVQIRANVQKSQAQLVSIQGQRFSLQEQPGTTRRDAATHLQELERQVQTLKQGLDLSTRVVSPFSGQIVELKVYEGSSVVTGTPVLSLQPEAGKLEVVAFIPTGEAKRVLAGMAVQVSPSTIKREEYGFIQGQVTYVSDFPTTNAAAMRTFENDSLVKSLSSKGMVNEVRVVLLKSANVSGYEWSSKKSPNQSVSSGTLCTIEVVTRQRRPIELVAPFLKGLFNAAS